MRGWSKGRTGRSVLRLLGAGVVGLLSVGTAAAQSSEIDAFQRAVNTQSREDTLAFMEAFGSSHLVPDLIELLRPQVAAEVCAELRGTAPRLRAACDHARRQAALAEAQLAPESAKAAKSASQANVELAAASTGTAPSEPATPAAAIRPQAAAVVAAAAPRAAAASEAAVRGAVAAVPLAPPSGEAAAGLTKPAASRTAVLPVSPADEAAAPSGHAFAMLPEPTFAMVEDPLRTAPAFLASIAGPIRPAEPAVSIAERRNQADLELRDSAPDRRGAVVLPAMNRR